MRTWHVVSLVLHLLAFVLLAFVLLASAATRIGSPARPRHPEQSRRPNI